MSKEKTIPASTFLQEIFQVGVYKRSQGRVTRQVTFAALAVALALGAWRLHQTLITVPPLFNGMQYVLPGFVLLAGLWLSYRAVNVPRFADFLIAVEAEMNKVSWPTRNELFRSALVVIIVIFLMAAVLFGYDLVWKFVFQTLGIVE